MFEFLSKLFGGFEGSKNRAKERLRLVLVHDRASLSGFGGGLERGAD